MNSGGVVEKPASSGAVVAAYVLAAFALSVWLILLPGLTSLDSSDAAGNAMAQGLTALVVVIVWILLAIVALLCWAKGRMPAWAGLAALLLVPGSCIAAFGALEMLGHSNLPPFAWPVVAVAAPPPLILAYCLWAITPLVRRRLPEKAMSIGVWGAVLALSLSVVAMQSVRDAALEKKAAALAAWRAEIEATPADAPLWRWTALLGRGFYDEGAVIDKIRKLDRRQSDAETMLKRGDFPLADLNRFDLDPTPGVCFGAKAELQAEVAPLVAAKPQTRSYAVVSDKVDAAIAAYVLAGRLRLRDGRRVPRLAIDGRGLSRSGLVNSRTR